MQENIRKEIVEMLPNKETFAPQWIDAWNSHDLDQILSHYSDDVEVVSPMIAFAMESEDGTIRGKQAVRQYWHAALQKVPDLHFELIASTESVDSIALYYKSVLGKMAIETMFFNAEGKITKVIAHYS